MKALTSWSDTLSFAVSIFLATFVSIQSSDIAPVFRDRGTENRHHCLLTGPPLSPSWSIILASLFGSRFGPIGSTVFLSSGLPITLCLHHIGGGHIWMCNVKDILSCWSNRVMPILLGLTRTYSSYGGAGIWICWLMVGLQHAEQSRAVPGASRAWVSVAEWMDKSWRSCTILSSQRHRGV